MEENHNTKILLVDDDRFLLDMYVLKFKKSGFNVDVASNGAVVLEKLREGEKYEIIILDIIMPTMDGLELLKTIREEKLAEGSVIVILSNEGEKMHEAEKLGIDGYIIKAMSIPSEVVDAVIGIYKNKKQK
jgi:two-component system alkaline phosphatase synthesis response regulator PhoP